MKKDNDIITRALKQVLLRDKDSIAFLKNLAAERQVDFSVVDNNKKLLWGTNSDFPFENKLERDGNLFGVLKSNTEKGEDIAKLISILSNKEFEKKKIGKEVLSLYREINMIYGLSEMISEKIDAGPLKLHFKKLHKSLIQPMACF